jgi:hypothetical protein
LPVNANRGQVALLARRAISSAHRERGRLAVALRCADWSVRILNLPKSGATRRMSRVMLRETAKVQKRAGNSEDVTWVVSKVPCFFEDDTKRRRKSLKFRRRHGALWCRANWMGKLQEVSCR